MIMNESPMIGKRVIPGGERAYISKIYGRR